MRVALLIQATPEVHRHSRPGRRRTVPVTASTMTKPGGFRLAQASCFPSGDQAKRTGANPCAPSNVASCFSSLPSTVASMSCEERSARRMKATVRPSGENATGESTAWRNFAGVPPSIGTTSSSVSLPFQGTRVRKRRRPSGESVTSRYSIPTLDGMICEERPVRRSTIHTDESRSPLT